MLAGVLLALGAAQLPPIDQCAADASFVAFRKALTVAVERRDVNALMGLVDDQVQVDFGGGSGKGDFRQAWTLDQPGKSGVWREVKEALRLGCAVQDGVNVSPSFGAQLDPDTDPYDAYLAVQAGAEVRREPGGKGDLLRKLHWDVLTFVPGSDDTDYLKVKIPDGRVGFVRAGDVRSAVSYRLLMQQVGGAWRITAFVAGD